MQIASVSYAPPPTVRQLPWNMLATGACVAQQTDAWSFSGLTSSSDAFCLPRRRVLDVGGVTGIHAECLVRDGYEVTLVDPVPRHVESASAVCSAMVGDARDLPQPDDSFDVVQLLGPLYHLPDLDDRRRALAEAHRVVKPGGLIAAAPISRYASLFEHVTYAHLHTERIQGSVSKILETAVYDGVHGFTPSYFHRPKELVNELTESGLTDVRVFGIEGPAWSLVKVAEQQPGEGPIR